MFGLKPKLPITEDERLWVDDGLRRLSLIFGRHRLLDVPVILPTDEFFPDPYHNDEAGLRALFLRVCGYMRVDPARVDLQVLPDSSELKELLPHYQYASNDPAGLHFGASPDGRSFIAVRQSLVKDPLAAVATLAHELCHVLLLDDGHLSRNAEDMEPLTDLATVFLGMGIFTANASRRFQQFQNDRRQGWSMSHQGYLPEIIYGYALARFAEERGENQPTWTAHLSTNLKAYFRQSAAWLANGHRPLF